MPLIERIRTGQVVVSAATVWAVMAAMGLPALLFAPWLLTTPAGEDASGRAPADTGGRLAGRPESGAPPSPRESR